MILDNDETRKMRGRQKNNCQNDTCPPVTVVDAKLGDKNDLSVPYMII